MKDGKPEVLIIGERHPMAYLLSKFPNKFADISYDKKLIKNVVVPDLDSANLDDLMQVGRDVSFIVENEVDIIKKFNAKRLLFEHPSTKATAKISAELRSHKDLRKFQNAMLDVEQKVAKEENALLIRMFRHFFKSGLKPPFDVPLTANHKWLSFLIGLADVYDIQFFDDYKLGLIETAYHHLQDYIRSHPSIAKNLLLPKDDVKKLIAANNAKREAKMLLNIKKSLADRTVIICGFAHLKTIYDGLKAVAFLHEPYIIG